MNDMKNFVFLRRQRALTAGESPYIVLMDSVKVQASSVEMQVVNAKSLVRLHLQIFSLKDNTARMKIKELVPIKERYEIPVGDALVGEPKLQE